MRSELLCIVYSIINYRNIFRVPDAAENKHHIRATSGARTTDVMERR